MLHWWFFIWFLIVVWGSPRTGRFLLFSVLILVGDYGDGFPVDSSPCIFLIFPPLPPLDSQSWISYFMWLVCGLSQTGGTWVDGFFHGAGGDTFRGRGVFSLL